MTLNDWLDKDSDLNNEILNLFEWKYRQMKQMKFEEFQRQVEPCQVLILAKARSHFDYSHD
jgi:hypothetical protein